MKRATWILILALISGAALPGAAAADEDEDGIGVIIDWINKLSGPTMIGPAVSYYRVAGAVRIRLSAGYMTSVASDDVLEPDGSKVTMLSIKPAVEFPVGTVLSVGAGVSIHQFGGDADEGFTHWSVPVYAQARFAVLEGERGPSLFVRVGLGAEYFPEFDAGAFDPITTGVSEDGGEFTFIAFVGIEKVISWRGLAAGAR